MQLTFLTIIYYLFSLLLIAKIRKLRTLNFYNIGPRTLGLTKLSIMIPSLTINALLSKVTIEADVEYY
jgi:hypothetical protein